MFDPLFSSTRGVTLLGGGEATPQDVREALSHAPDLVAADGGARLAVDMGLTPEAVIGDFDSLGALDAKIPKDRLHRVDEQDSTDFEKCLRHVKAPFILGVGFSGGRLDHELAALSGLLRYPGSNCILIGKEDLVFAAPRKIRLDLPVGCRLSLFPMAKVTGRSQGLRWPIDGLDLQPGGRIGTSNKVTGPVALEFDGPGMLVIAPREVLGHVITALRG